MSFIRALEQPEWEEGIGDGWYAYGDGDGICGLPRQYRPFIEVVMRMLDQTGELSEEELETVHAALRSRLRIEEGTVGKHNDEQPAYGIGGDS